MLAAYLASRRFTTEARSACLTLTPTLTPALTPHQITDDDHMADLAAAIKVGDRCEVRVLGVGL